MSRRELFRRWWLRALTLAALCAGVPARAAPEPIGGAADLARAPLAVAGDVIGGTGLLGAALVATLGDAIACVDDNVVLRGFASRAVHELARALSWGGTSALEILRGDDIERLPEPRAAYREAAPFTGRLDTAFTGVAALRLALHDALLAPTGALLRTTGAQAAAQSVAVSREEAALRWLGPPPACDVAERCGS
jgi:hypothetical protein